MGFGDPDSKVFPRVFSGPEGSTSTCMKQGEKVDIQDVIKDICFFFCGKVENISKSSQSNMEKVILRSLALVS